jgi:signal transduction histidine kinase
MTASAPRSGACSGPAGRAASSDSPPESGARLCLPANVDQTERLCALGLVAGGMAHDLNNILTAITTYAGLAKMTEPAAEVNEALEQILKAADRGRNLTRTVFEFGRQQASPRTALDLRSVACEVRELLRPLLPAGIELRTEFDHAPVEIFANSTQMHQVLTNLCQNAIQALAGKSGTIVVQVGRHEVGAAAAGGPVVLRPGPHACLRVSDTGHGMDAATRRRIFEPLFTTKAGGQHAGLGLALVQRIAHEHGASIRVDSEPGQGTCFEIFFPAIPAPSASP